MHGVFLTMGADEVTTGGEVVYLLAELRSDERGRVHEIGSRATVLGWDGDDLTISVGNGLGDDVVTCSRALVAARRRSLASRRRLRANASTAA